MQRFKTVVQTDLAKIPILKFLLMLGQHRLPSLNITVHGHVGICNRHTKYELG